MATSPDFMGATGWPLIFTTVSPAVRHQPHVLVLPVDGDHEIPQQICAHVRADRIHEVEIGVLDPKAAQADLPSQVGRKDRVLTVHGMGPPDFHRLAGQAGIHDEVRSRLAVTGRRFA